MRHRMKETLPMLCCSQSPSLNEFAALIGGKSLQFRPQEKRSKQRIYVRGLCCRQTNVRFLPRVASFSTCLSFSRYRLIETLVCCTWCAAFYVNREDLSVCYI